MKLSILSNLFTECWWWLLFWMFLAFLLGWILRKLIGGSEKCDCCDELADYKSRYATLETKYANLNVTKEKVETVLPVSNLKAKTKKKFLATTPTKAKAYAKLKDDNLQIVEGIGPKMNEVLNKYGIGTWSSLAKSDKESLRAILDKENPTRYRIIDPTTWADQANLAAEGKWEALIAIQKNIDKGNNKANASADSKLEKIMIKLGLIKKWKQDDLKAVEGIGPKIARLLNDSGINTWKQLANTPLNKLKKVLENAGSRFKLADPGTWAKQAQLADEGKWDELQEYQDFLDGGR